MRRKIPRLCVLFLSLALTVVLLVSLHRAGYRVNRSSSLPGSVYRLTPLRETENLSCGDCVAIDLTRFRNPVIMQGVARGYVNLREPMLKRIGATPGDRVEMMGHRLFVNGASTPMRVASADSFGGMLAPWPTPLILSEDHYWLVSDPHRGFDSRYFGPLPRTSFTHRAIVLF